MFFSKQYFCIFLNADLCILLTADFKPEQIRIVSFVVVASDRNDSVKFLNH